MLRSKIWPLRYVAGCEAQLVNRARYQALYYKCSMSLQFESSQAAILDRVIQPDLADWPRAAAEAILVIGFDATDRERMTSLLEKAKAGDCRVKKLRLWRLIGISASSWN
jgi:hypothetical protein